MTVYQISVFLENRAGQLAEIAKILGDNGIDMRAISIAETTDYGVLRLIVDQPQKTTSILLQRGFILSMTPVLVVAVQDHPGGLAPILQLIAEGSIDIEYMYSLFTHKDGKAYMVFRVSDEEKFTALLAQHGIAMVAGEELGIQDYDLHGKKTTGKAIRGGCNTQPPRTAWMPTERMPTFLQGRFINGFFASQTASHNGRIPLCCSLAKQGIAVAHTRLKHCSR